MGAEWDHHPSGPFNPYVFVLAACIWGIIALCVIAVVT